MRRHARLFLFVAAMLALAAVFALYTQPDFVVQLSNQLWSCF